MRSELPALSVAGTAITMNAFANPHEKAAA
jgi:hypothetical protein